MAKLIIDGTRADIGSAVIAITRAAASLEQPGIRRISISNKIKLPTTAVNNNIFELANDLRSAGSAYIRTYKATYIDDDGLMVFDGTLLLNAVSDYYEVQLVDDSKLLFDSLNQDLSVLLKDRTEEIEYSEASYNTYNTAISGLWRWPLYNNAEYDSTTEALTSTWRNCRPSLGYKELMDLCFAASGYTINWGDIDVSGLCVPTGLQEAVFVAWRKTLAADFTANDNLLPNLDTNDYVSPHITFSTSPIAGLIVQNNVNDLPSKLIFNGQITGSTELRVGLSVIGYTGLGFTVYNNNTLVDLIDGNNSVITEYNGSDVLIEWKTAVGFEGYGVIKAGTVFELLHDDNTAAYGAVVLGSAEYLYPLKYNMPKMTALELFRTVLMLTNSIFDIDDKSKVVYIKSLKNLKHNNYIDWSGKTKQAEKADKIGRIDNLGQVNYLRFTADIDTLDTSGQESFGVSFKAKEAEKTYLELPIRHCDAKLTLMPGIDAGWGYAAYMPRYLFDGANWWLGNTIKQTLIRSEAQEYTAGVHVGVPIRWSDYIHYYQGFIDAVDTPMQVTIELALTPLDVYFHDFTKLVYISELYGYYYVYDITAYIPGKLTKIKLLRYG